MYIYSNMDSSLIRKHPVSAVSMGSNDLHELFRKALSPFITDEMFEDPEPIDPDILLDIALCDEHGAFPMNQLYQDIHAAVKMDPKSVAIRYDDLSRNGIPAIQVNLRDENNMDVAVLVYWDGNAFRGYVPMYGNTINPFLGCAYGSEGEADPNLYLGKEYALQANVSFASLSSESEDYLPENETVRIALTKDNYQEAVLRFEPCAEACADDFFANVTACGKLSSEEAWELSHTIAIKKDQSDKRNGPGE